MPRKQKAPKQRAPKQKAPKQKAPPEQLSAEEADAVHISYMNNHATLAQFWESIQRPPNSFIARPRFALEVGGSLTREVKANLDQKIMLPSKNLKQWVEQVASTAQDATKILIPFGSVRTDGSIHWILFIVDNSILRVFNPATQADGDTCYYFCSKTFDALKGHIVATFKLPPQPEQLLFPIQQKCQVDDIRGIGMPDPFCQTWIALFAEYYLNVMAGEDYEPCMERFIRFKFFSSGKPVLRAWLMCKYKNIEEKFAEGPTWYDWMVANGLGALFQVKGRRVRALSAVECWHILRREICRLGDFIFLVKGLR